MRCLAIFDFDKTIIDDDSDATIIRKLRDRRTQPHREHGSKEWTPYMSNVFEYAHAAGLSQEEILSSIASMKPTAGMVELITWLSTTGWDILVITDANSVFVHHWLKTHHLEDKITSVITNRAFFENGRLYIEPCMTQNTCGYCPSNLCKSLALVNWSHTREPYDLLIYTGDGKNDFCPSANLSEESIVFPRKDYVLHRKIQKAMMAPSTELKCKIVPWEDGFHILHTLMTANV